MAIAPLIVQIRAAGAAALGRASAQLRAFGSTVSSTSRRLFAQTRAVSSVAGAYQDANGMWRNANGTLLTQRHTVTQVTTAFGHLVRVLHRVRNAALAAAAAIGGPLRRALRAAQDAATSLARSLLRWTGILSAVLPVVFALSNVLANLLPLVMHLAPAAFAAGAALAVLKLGFDGIGDALSAGLSGDMEEFSKALKKLAPSAQQFVKELVKIAPAWRWLKTQIQEKIFFKLGAEIRLLSSAYFPILTRWLGRTAELFNQFFHDVSRGLRAPEVMQQIDVIFAGAITFIGNMLQAVKSLGRAFLDIAEVAAPAFAALGNSTAQVAENFAKWIREMRDNGKLKEWLDQAKETFNQLMGIGKEIGRVFAAIFKGTDEGGFLENLRNSIAELADFLEGEDGQAMIEFFSDVAKAAAGLIRTIGDVVRWFQEGIDILRDLAGNGEQAIGAAFRGIGTAASALFLVISGGVNAFAWIGGVVGRLGGLVAAVRGAVSAINAALSAIRTTVFIDIITRRSGTTGVARAIGGGGGGGRIVARAHGGPVRAGQPYVVGDAGKPEVFIPGQNGYIMPRVPTGGGGGMPLSGTSRGLEALFETWLLNRIRTGHLPLRVVGNRVVPV